jgi:hypothetical protein
MTTVNVVENAVPSPITNASLSAIGNTCYVFGGTDINGACFNDIRFVDLTEYLDERDITVGEGAASDYSFKILIIGDAAVGKSALLTRFSENVFLDSYTSTIGLPPTPHPPLLRLTPPSGRHRLQLQNDPRGWQHLQARDLGYRWAGAFLDHHRQLLPRCPRGAPRLRHR